MRIAHVGGQVKQLHPFAHAQCTSLNLVQPGYVHKSCHWLHLRLAKQHLTFQSVNTGYATAVAAQLMNDDRAPRGLNGVLGANVDQSS